MACDSPLIIEVKGRINKIPVPCGKCPPCKIRKVNDWVFRLKQEDKVSSSSCFLTLTYDTAHVPITNNGFLTLKKRDFQLFMKRLRKKLPNDKLKYYACGEYGTISDRPHYHAILFNCSDPALINDAWGLGQIHLGTCTGDSIAYCLKYINKPGKIPKHRRDDRLKEFATQSKNLGAAYLTPAVVNHHRRNFVDLRVQNNEYKIAMPRYYRHKIFDKQERRAQLPFIANGVQQTSDKQERDFALIPYKDLTFEEYTNLKRYGRFRKFYSFTNQNRNTI